MYCKLRSRRGLGQSTIYKEEEWVKARGAGVGAKTDEGSEQEDGSWSEDKGQRYCRSGVV